MRLREMLLFDPLDGKVFGVLDEVDEGLNLWFGEAPDAVVLLGREPIPAGEEFGGESVENGHSSVLVDAVAVAEGALVVEHEVVDDIEEESAEESVFASSEERFELVFGSGEEDAEFGLPEDEVVLAVSADTGAFPLLVLGCFAEER